MNQAQQAIFAKTVVAMSEMMGKSDLRIPLLVDANNKPLQPSASYQYRRAAARREGSMLNWTPQRVGGEFAENAERKFIVERSIDLANNDPHAAGIIDTFATTVVGSGLVPQPSLDSDILGLDREEIRKIRAQQKKIYMKWAPMADAGQRLSFGGIQFVCQRNLIQYGEYIVLLPMIKDPARSYSLACQVINPLRLKTPSDLTSNPNIKDGVEIGSYGEPIAYWIEKADSVSRYGYSSNHSAQFTRIPAKKGHRWNVIHEFIPLDAEQVRGIPSFAPAMKYMRDLNDYLDAELVSNIVTAAFALFIEVGSSDPMYDAINNAQVLGTDTKSDGTTYQTRYQEVAPGSIMYGNKGEKPSPISANRPGTTFDPFTKIIKKAIAMALNIPYPVLFKDVEGVNFAGFRSAMLEAWRTYMTHRFRMGHGLCQKTYTMLMEEAYLRNDLLVPNFYSDMPLLTYAEWRGYPKGDIEPVKAAQADVLRIQNNLKTRAKAIAEDGDEFKAVVDQLEEEQEMLRERKLTEDPFDPGTIKDDNPDGGGNG
jgi:lambda family phage portal protein